MAKITENTIYNWLQLLPKIGQYLSSARQKARAALKTTSYWSAVVVLGITITAGIMHAAGVPLTSSAEALTDGQYLAIFIGNILYYGWIGPVSGILLISLAYVLQIIINYPHGDFWATIDTSDDIAVGFVRVEAVVTGWKLVRDISNVFFSVILVVIALGSVLKIEAYSWKQLLPKFVVMAILINFSKTICGVFTDVATVAMATFAGSFGSSFALGLIGAFNLPSILDFAPNENNSTYEGTSAVALVSAYIAAAIMTMVFGILMIILVAVFFMRVVMLWFLIVLSPMAYIARILPLTKSYSSEWWGMFGKWVMVGPMMTFFLWLTLTMAYGVDSGNPITEGGFSEEAAQRVESRLRVKQPESGFQATSTSQLATFLIATVMLMGSMSLVKRMADGAGSIVGKAEGLGYAAFGNAIKAGNMRRMTSGAGAMIGRMGDNRFTRAVNGGMQLLAGTAFNPEGVVQQIGERISKRRESSEKLMDARFSGTTGAVNAKTNEWVGKGGATGAAASVLQLLASAVGSVGKDGQVYWDNTFTMQGAERMFRQVAGGKSLTADKAEAKGQADQIADIKKRQAEDSKGNLGEVLTTEAYERYAAEQANIEQQLKHAEDSHDALESGNLDQVALNTSTDDIAADGISKLVADLEKQQEAAVKGGNQQEAADIGAQIDAIKEHTQNNPGSSLKALQDAMAGAQGAGNGAVDAAMNKMMQRMQRAYKSKENDSALWNRREQIMKGMKDVNPNQLMSMDAMEAELSALRTKIGGKDVYGMPVNMQARAAMAGAVKESRDSMAGMSQQQLRGQLALAQKIGNRPQAIAALQELSQKPWGIQHAMRDMTGSYDYEGAQKMTGEIQKLLGGDEQGAMAMMSDLLSQAGASHLNGMFFDTANGWVMNSQKATTDIAAGNMMQDGITALARKNGDRAFFELRGSTEVLSQASIKAILAGAQAWGNDLEFRKLPDSLKAKLAAPAIIETLEEKGVDAKFIEKLRSYKSPI